MSHLVTAGTGLGQEAAGPGRYGGTDQRFVLIREVRVGATRLALSAFAVLYCSKAFIVCCLRELVTRR